MYETTVTASGSTVEIRAYGGTRRGRGSKIAAEVRKLRAKGTGAQRIAVSYDEAYGFMTMTVARYATRA